MSSENAMLCKYHSYAPLIEDHAAGDIICAECGLVVGDRLIDVSAEWRSFSSDAQDGRQPSRVGGPENPLLSDGGLTTKIGPVAWGKKPAMTFSPKLANRNTDAACDLALRMAIGEIAEMAARINLPRPIIERANYLFREVQDCCLGSTKSHSVKTKATACLYIACRQEGVPRTFKEICAISHSSKREIGRCFKHILKVLNTNLDVIKSGDFMARFCSTLGLPVNVETTATHIAKAALEMGIVNGKSPISVAAASIYMASQLSGLGRCHEDISHVVGVTETTIRGTYKELRPVAKRLLPRESKFVPLVDTLPEN